MKPTNIVLTITTGTLIFLFCAQPAGPRRVLAAGTALTDHPLKVKHTHDDDDNVTWEIKENGKGAFHLRAQTNQIIEWKNMDPKEKKMSIIVNNTNDWQPVQGTFGPPTYGSGCAKCGQMDTMNGIIQLTFVGTNKDVNYHYQIVVPNPDRARATTYDYDMVDATVVWSDVLKDKYKAPSKDRRQ
jgi:hypothetical protein